MGSGNLFKTIIGLKKGKERSPKKPKGTDSVKSKGFRSKNIVLYKPPVAAANGNNPETLEIQIEDLAATKIQTAFRAYMARKRLRRLKGMVRAKALTQKRSVKKQAANTLSYIHSWSKIQLQIRARRIYMVTEGKLKQKKLENQQKLEAKLHDLEVEWCGGSDTKEEILARINQREEAAVKRERAMAYAFSHQWRADSRDQGLGNYEIGKTNWGWSWKERWIASRPWEARYSAESCGPKKSQNNKTASRNSMNSPVMKATDLVKTDLSDIKGTKARRSSFPGAEKPAARLAS